MYAVKGRGGWIKRVHLLFGEIILLLNMYKGRRGFKNLDYLSLHTYWQAPRTISHQEKAKLESNDGAKLLSEVDP